jgi:hypothetical protein
MYDMRNKIFTLVAAIAAFAVGGLPAALIVGGILLYMDN